MKPILLIDGDQFLFKATAAVEREVRWDEQNHTLCANEAEAWDNLTQMIERLFTRFETREHALCFSSAPNFRLKVSPDYKGNRKDSRKPLCYTLLRERLEADFKCVAKPTLEADDVMGILATKPDGKRRIIVSQDKDMKTIPGELWNGRDGKLQTITPAQADYWHLYQTLIGDIGDGYKGCPAIGPKKAEVILAGGLASDVAWGRVVATYAKAKLTEADALVQARLARILRWDDWDSEKQEPKLWTPTVSNPSPKSSPKSSKTTTSAKRSKLKT